MNNADTAAANGRIVTFYSYKGGTGRTMALANLAWILASNGSRVLAVDWDLESPGLHRYFHPFLTDKILATTPGVIDIVRDVAKRAMAPTSGSSPETDTWFADHANILTHAMSLEWPFQKPGTLDFLPAGKQEIAYTTAVSTFDWVSFYERLGGGTFLNMLSQSMREHYDYTLIDSRTGLSDTAGFLTMGLPDLVVNCFTLSTQSIDGALNVAKQIRGGGRRDKPVTILPVPMRVEDAEQIKLEAGRDYARAQFSSYLTNRDPVEVERYWGEVEIPYKPFYAYEEILATFGDRGRQENTLLAAYERLARVVTAGEVTGYPAIDERDRRTWLAEFERPRIRTTADVMISYASIDRMWAEWVAAELRDAGLAVSLQEVTSSGGPEGLDTNRVLASANRLLVLLSQEYTRAENAVGFWKLAIERDPAGRNRYLVPVKLSGRRLPAPFSERSAVDLQGLQSNRARDAILSALDQPTHVLAGSRLMSTDRRPRFPGELPPVWSVPARNSGFTGRAAILEQLRDQLSTKSAQSLYGLGGVGKTQIALEYAHRFAADYDVVWWISGDQTSMVRSSLAQLGAQLELATGESVTERVEAVLDALRRGSPYARWLIVLDNADSPEELRPFIPQGPGHMIITSRNQGWVRPEVAIEVGVFDREESIAFLRRQVPQIGEADAIRVADKLGDLPLAIEQAGAWLSATAMPVSDYLELLDTSLLRMLEENIPVEYQQSATATWSLSLDRMREEMPAAAKLLELCAFFAPEPIPMSLVRGDRFVNVLVPYDPSLRDPILHGRMIREIGRYALAKVDPRQSSIQIHRLVQAVIRSRLDDAERIENRVHVHEVLAAANPRDPDNAETWPAYADLRPHVVPSGALESANPEVRLLVIDLVRYLWRIADYVASQELAEEALKHWTRGTDERIADPVVLLLRFHLANALRLQAQYAKAYEIDQDAYDRLSELEGVDHPYTLMVAQSIGADLRQLGRYAPAREIDDDTLGRYREVFGPDNPRTLMAANNLAVSQRLAGDFLGATAMDEDTYSRRQRVLGPRHPHTLFSASSYGRDLRESGEFTESRKLLESTLEVTRSVLGAEHPETLSTAKNLAVTLRKLGELRAAHAMTSETLVRLQRVLGRNHPETLACLVNLACDLSAVRKDTEARDTAEDALDRYRTVLGNDHAFTQACTNNLAIFIRIQGHAEIARPLAQGALDNLRNSLGAQHPYTLACQVNLANNLFDLGQYSAALELDDKTYRSLSERLGEDHPDTLAAGSNLAISRDRDGERASARDLQQTVVGISVRRLGDKHPNTKAVRDGVRLNCDIEPAKI
jgi:tetratricopeptide (TPR) repeat protein